MIENAVTDFPEPDSPTTHTISRSRMSRSIASTAFARSAPAGSRTVRPRTSSTFGASVTAEHPVAPPSLRAQRSNPWAATLAPTMDCFVAALLEMTGKRRSQPSQPLGEPRIERVAQPVAQHVDRVYRDGEADAREEDRPGRNLKHPAA